jgi:hypothetical protein
VILDVQHDAVEAPAKVSSWQSQAGDVCSQALELFLPTHLGAIRRQVQPVSQPVGQPTKQCGWVQQQAADQRQLAGPWVVVLDEDQDLLPSFDRRAAAFYIICRS